MKALIMFASYCLIAVGVIGIIKLIIFKKKK